jgi:TonB-dependent starch-binding outer membrane protein SusC
MRMPWKRALKILGRILTSAVAAACVSAVPSPEDAASETDTAGQTIPTTASDASMRRDDMRDQSYSRIEELIEGRAAGVQVIRRSDGTFSLRIRGISSPSGNNEPLVVIDGTPVLESRVGQALLSLNPQDVVQIDVLKDAASTAFYGMRGANGVIVITTRRQ